MRRECGVVLGPPVITRLPLTVHLMAASKTCGGEMLPRPWFKVLQMISGLGQSSSMGTICARSTMRLGLGGLTPAVAEYVLWDCLLNDFASFCKGVA